MRITLGGAHRHRAHFAPVPSVRAAGVRVSAARKSSLSACPGVALPRWPMYLHVGKYMRKHPNWFLRRKRCSARARRVPIAIMHGALERRVFRARGMEGDRRLSLTFADRASRSVVRRFYFCCRHRG